MNAKTKKTKDVMKPISLLALLAIFCLLISGCGSGNKGPLRIGSTAPFFSTKDINGGVVEMGALEVGPAGPMIIRFFLTDCKFCRADTVVFNEYYKKYHAKGLKIIYITSTEDSKVVRQFADDLQIKFPVVIDKNGAIAQKYSIKAVPQAVIISPDHKILTAILGGVSGLELEDVLASYLHK